MPRRGESQYAVSSPGKTEDHKYARGHKQLSMNPPSVVRQNSARDFWKPGHKHYVAGDHRDESSGTISSTK